MTIFFEKKTESNASPQTRPGDEIRLYNMMLWAYVTVLPAAALFFVTATISDSIVLFVYLAWYSISFAVQTFSLYAVRQTIRRNPNLFPYGAGKLENFSAFLDGVLIVPVGVYLIFNSFSRLLHPLPVGYVLGMIPVIITGLRLAFLYRLCRRLTSETVTPSPILLSYTIGFRIALFSNVGVLLAFMAGRILIYYGLPEIGNRVDPVIGLLLALYMVFAGIRLIRRNFRSLMDLPLTEKEQLCVLNVLASFYDHYEGIGTIYSRTSGNEKFVELELLFPADKTLKDIQGLAKTMEKDLVRKLPGLKFRIIPVTPAQ